MSAKRACPSFLLDDSILFDIGPGSLRNLRISNVNLDSIQSLFISHTHADHVADLIPFLWAAEIDRRREALTVYGPPGFKEIFHKLNECTNTPINFFTFPLSVLEINFGDKIGNVSTCATNHSIPTLAFRVDLDAKSFCYSADTTYSSAIVRLAEDADILLHEATFLDDQAAIADLTRHSTARVAGQVGREARAKRLLLFHIPPPNEAREDEFNSQAAATYGERPTICLDMEQIEI